jgi:hypothetical protein
VLSNLENHSDFLLRCIAAWVAAAFAIGGGFLNYHFTALGFGLIGVGVTALIFDLWLYSKQQQPNWYETIIAPLVIFLQMNFIGAVVIAGATYAELLPPTFRLVSQSQIIMPYKTDTRTSTAVSLVEQWHAGKEDGQTDYPINLLVELELSNLLNQPRNIEGYALEVKLNPFFWSRLCEVDLSKGNTYFFTSQTDGWQRKLDLLLPKLGKTILPKAAITGWSAWECLGEECATAPKRLRLLEKDGHQETISLANVRGQAPDQFKAKGTIPFAPVKNFAWDNTSVWSSAFCSGQAVP